MAGGLMKGGGGGGGGGDDAGGGEGGGEKNVMPNINIISNAREVINPQNPMAGVTIEAGYDRGAIDGSFSPGGAFGAGGAYGMGGAYGIGGAYGPPVHPPIMQMRGMFPIPVGGMYNLLNQRPSKSCSGLGGMLC